MDTQKIEQIALCIWLALFLFVIVQASIKYQRKLKKMTPEEREAHKKEMFDEGRNW